MAEVRTILEILKDLQDYYRYEYNDTQVAVLTRQLGHIPDDLLREAADKWMDIEGTWLPKGSHLLKLADKISRDKRFFEHVGELEVPIWAGLQALKDQAYRQGIVEHQAWDRLLERAQNERYESMVDCIHKAYQAVLNPQSAEECRRYAQWNQGAGEYLHQPDPEIEVKYHG